MSGLSTSISPLLSVIKAELAPFDGRLNTAWRVAATCALTVMLFMVYGIPLVAIGCYLILFVIKPNHAETMLMAIGICLLVAIMVPVLFGLTIISIEYPTARMAVLVASSVFFMFLGAASQLGPAGGIIALVIVFILTVLGEVPTGEIATRGILYAVLMALVPMGTLIVFNALVGPSVPKAIYKLLAARMHTIANAVANTKTQPNSITANGNSHHQVLALLHAGDDELTKMLLFTRLLHLVPKAELELLQKIARASDDLLLASAALSQSAAADATVERQSLARQCREIAQTLEQGQLPEPSSTIVADQAQPQARLSAQQLIASTLAQFPTPLPSAQIDTTLGQKGFFYADAWRNPLYPRYALKTTLAAVICYLIYTAIQWQDIHTALITCYVGALGTTAETLHKLTLRITGCLIGAAIGVASIYFLMPHMTSIGDLMLLVFAVCLLAAWVSSGSELSSYAGVQIGLAFLLTVLVDFGPSVDMSHALYRTMGILLGNVVLYLVFTRIWPISAAAAASSHMQQVLASLRQRLDSAGGLLEPATLRADAANVLRIIQQARTQLALIKFEPASVHPDVVSIGRLRLLIDQVEEFYLQNSFSATGAADSNPEQLLNSLQAALTGK